MFLFHLEFGPAWSFFPFIVMPPKCSVRSRPPSAWGRSLLHEIPVSGSQPSNVTSLVQDALTVAQSALSGGPSLVGNESLPEQLFASPSLAIDSRVSDKLRSKIWKNEYFEFSALLSNPVFDSKYQLTINKADKGSVPVLCLEPVSQTENFLSIESWLKCCHVFVGAYTRKYPNEAPDLMKYGEVVKDFAARGHNWKFYDENFHFFTSVATSCNSMEQYPLGVMDMFTTDGCTKAHSYKSSQSVKT